MTNPIPENVIYVLKPASHVLVDDITEKVQGAAIVDANNSSSLKAALRWAGPQAVQHCRPNEDIPSLRFIQVKYGRHHASSWHARIFDRFHVEVSDDTLADLLRNGTMEDGKFLGPFRWGTAGSGLKLVRVGSAKWGVISGKLDRRKMPKIRKSALEVGRVYVHENLTSWIYLGEVETVRYTGTSRGSTSTIGNLYTSPAMTYRRVANAGELWVPLQAFPITDLYNIEIRSWHRVTEAGEMAADLPSDPIAAIRDFARSQALESIAARNYHNAQQDTLPSYYGRSRIGTPDLNYFADRSYHLLMHRKGEPEPVIPELAGIEKQVVP